jgi:transcriptional regulator with XRE-family HTH domain
MAVSPITRRRSPLIRRRRLARELRELREQAGLTAEQLARASGLARTGLSRFETAERVPGVGDVDAIIKALGITDEDQWHTLVQMAEDAAEKGWWAGYGAAMGERQAVYADLEYGARTVREYQSFVIPGLLQSAEYTRSRAELYRKQARLPADPRSVDRAVEAKTMRARMLRRPGGPQYEAVIDETAIRRPAAPPDVMHAQLMHLVAVAEQDDRVTILVLPLRAQIEDYWLPRSPFSVYDYADGDPAAAAVDTETQDLIYTDQIDVAPYIELYQRVRGAALSPEDSAALLVTEAEASSRET